MTAETTRAALGASETPSPVSSPSEPGFGGPTPRLAPGKGRSHGTARCQGCGLAWTSRSEAHCSSCHEHFTGPGIFDQHIRAAGCTPPGELRHGRTGKPILEQIMRSGGHLAWRQYVDPAAPRPAFWRTP